MEERPIGNHKIQQSDKIIEMKTFAFISDATFMCLLNCFALFHQFEFLIGRFIGLMYSTVLQLRSTFLLPGPPHVARTLPTVHCCLRGSSSPRLLFIFFNFGGACVERWKLQKRA